MDQGTHYLTDNAVAQRYSVSRPTVWRWVSEGHLPRPVKLGENTTRWRLTDLLEWEQKEVA